MFLRVKQVDSRATLREENMANFNGIPYDNGISIEKSNFMMEICHNR